MCKMTSNKVYDFPHIYIYCAFIWNLLKESYKEDFADAFIAGKVAFYTFKVLEWVL